MALTDAPIRDSLVDGKWSKLWAGFFAQLVEAVRGVQDDITALQTATTVSTVRRVSTSPYAVVATDEVLIVDASAGNILINLQTEQAGRRMTIKKIDGTANTVTIDAFSTQTIDGSLTRVLTTQYSSIDILGDNIGGVWWIT